MYLRIVPSIGARPPFRHLPAISSAPSPLDWKFPNAPLRGLEPARPCHAVLIGFATSFPFVLTHPHTPLPSQLDPCRSPRSSNCCFVACLIALSALVFISRSLSSHAVLWGGHRIRHTIQVSDQLAGRIRRHFHAIVCMVEVPGSITTLQQRSAGLRSLHQLSGTATRLNRKAVLASPRFPNAIRSATTFWWCCCWCAVL